MDLWSLPMQRNFWKQPTYAPRFMPAIHLQIVARKHRRWQKYRHCLILNYATKNLLEWKCRCRLDIYTFIPMCVCIIILWHHGVFHVQYMLKVKMLVWKLFDLKMSIAQFLKTFLLLKLCFIVLCNLASLVKMKNKPLAIFKGYGWFVSRAYTDTSWRYHMSLITYVVVSSCDPVLHLVHKEHMMQAGKKYERSFISFPSYN